MSATYHQRRKMQKAMRLMYSSDRRQRKRGARLYRELNRAAFAKITVDMRLFADAMRHAGSQLRCAIEKISALNTIASSVRG